MPCNSWIDVDITCGELVLKGFGGPGFASRAVVEQAECQREALLDYVSGNDHLVEMLKFSRYNRKYHQLVRLTAGWDDTPGKGFDLIVSGYTLRDLTDA
jgi:hypothetical protein